MQTQAARHWRRKEHHGRHYLPVEHAAAAPGIAIQASRFSMNTLNSFATHVPNGPHST